MISVLNFLTFYHTQIFLIKLMKKAQNYPEYFENYRQIE